MFILPKFHSAVTYLWLPQKVAYCLLDDASQCSILWDTSPRNA